MTKASLHDGRAGDRSDPLQDSELMFLGTFEVRMDDKGRLVFPAKYRDELAAGIVLTKGQERCLYVFTIPVFRLVIKSLRVAPFTSKDARDYSRVFFAGASNEIPDRQGGIVVRYDLRA